MSKITGHFVVYVKEDGSLVPGEICTGVSCAITSVNPEEGCKLLGPFTIEIDGDARLTREEMFEKTGTTSHPARVIFSAYHPVVEAKSTEKTTEGSVDNVVDINSKVA